MEDDPEKLRKHWERLATQGLIRKKTATNLGQHAQPKKPARQVQADPTARYKGVKEPHVYLILLLDTSASMNPISRSLASGQRHCIQALRGSRKTIDGRLFIKQYFFGKEAVEWHDFEKLSPKQNSDNVLLLPTDLDLARDVQDLRLPDSSSTALYSTIHFALQDIVREYDQLKERTKYPSQYFLGIITDGANRVRGIEPSQLKDIQDDLREDTSEAENGREAILNRSILVALRSPDGLQEDQAYELGSALGVDETIVEPKDDKAIRRAFDLISKRVG